MKTGAGTKKSKFRQLVTNVNLKDALKFFALRQR
jgi:hypothetical protein